MTVKKCRLEIESIREVSSTIREYMGDNDIEHMSYDFCVEILLLLEHYRKTIDKMKIAE